MTTGTEEHPDEPTGDNLPWPARVELAIRDLDARVIDLEDAPAPRPDVRDLLRRMDETQHRYATVIQVVGYGGFFALWSTTYGRMPLSLFGVAGALIGVSLLAYVVWELFLVWRTASRIARARAEADLTELRLGEILDEGDDELHNWWRFIWIVGVITGVAGGLIVLGFYFWAALSGKP